MKVNVKLLSKGLVQAPNMETVSSADCNEYLLEKVLRPILRGEHPKFKDLDFDAYEEEDIRVLADYYEAAWRCGKKLGQMITAMESISPIPCRKRQFC